MKMNSKLQYSCVFIILIILLTCPVSAHSGGTDSRGGHNSPSGYHYHHGYPAHQHENGVCPYNYSDKTNHNSQSSTSQIVNQTKEKTSNNVIPIVLFVLLAVIYFVCFFILPAISEKAGDIIASVLCFPVFILMFVPLGLIALIEKICSRARKLKV